MANLPSNFKKTPGVKGSLFAFEDVAIGLVNGLNLMSVKFNADRRLIAYLCDGANGGYFSRALQVVFINRVQHWAKNPNELPGLNWEPYSEHYEEWKRNKYPGKGPWIRSGLLIDNLISIRSGRFGATVGFNPNVTAHQEGFGTNAFRSYGSGVKLSELAQNIEYGQPNYPGMPPRPLIGPSLNQFLRTHLPSMERAAEAGIRKIALKHERIPEGKKNIISGAGIAGLGQFSLNESGAGEDSGYTEEETSALMKKIAEMETNGTLSAEQRAALMSYRAGGGKEV